MFCFEFIFPSFLFSLFARRGISKGKRKHFFSTHVPSSAQEHTYLPTQTHNETPHGQEKTWYHKTSVKHGNATAELISASSLFSRARNMSGSRMQRGIVYPIGASSIKGCLLRGAEKRKGGARKSLALGVESSAGRFHRKNVGQRSIKLSSIGISELGNETRWVWGGNGGHSLFLMGKKCDVALAKRRSRTKIRLAENRWGWHYAVVGNKCSLLRESGLPCATRIPMTLISSLRACAFATPRAPPAASP